MPGHVPATIGTGAPEAWRAIAGLSRPENARTRPGPRVGANHFRSAAQILDDSARFDSRSILADAPMVQAISAGELLEQEQENRGGECGRGDSEDPGPDNPTGYPPPHRR